MTLDSMTQENMCLQARNNQLLQQHRPQLRQAGAAVLLQPQLPLQPQAMAWGGHRLLRLPQPLLHLKVHNFLLPFVLNQWVRLCLLLCITVSLSVTEQLSLVCVSIVALVV